MSSLNTPIVTEDIVTQALHRNLLSKVRATALYDLVTLFKTQIFPQLTGDALIVWFSWGHVDHLHLGIWLGTYLALHALEIGIYFYTRRHPIQDHQIKRWERFLLALFTVNSLYLGYAYYMFALGGAYEELFLILMVGIMYTVAQFSRADAKIACAMVIPIYVGMLAAHVQRGTDQDYALAMVITLAFGTSFSLVMQQSKQTFDALYARFLNEELLQALQTKHDEIARAKHDVEIASQAKSRFFAAASHDLRQPLHALSLLVGSLEHNVRQTQLLPTLRHMRAALSALESLFEDVLDIARLEGGKVDARIATVSSVPLFEQLEQEFRPVADAKGLQLRFRGPEAFLETDELLLKRVLANLVSNAIRYTDRGGVLVACRQSTQRGIAMIQVFDTGIGMSSGELDLIFEDFYQASLPENQRRRQREGVGLGLGIVKRLSGTLGIPVTVRSRPGKGSAFTLGVPLSEQAPVGPAAALDVTPMLSLTGRSIIVVDDDEMVVRAVTTLLNDWGATVFGATSKTALQKILGALSTPPDFLIADFQFEPDFTGADAIQTIREKFRTPVPAAIMTGNVSLVPAHVRQGERIHVFAKPVSHAKLRSLLHFNLVLPQPATNMKTGP